MEENIHLIGGLLGYVCHHGLFKSVYILNMTRKVQMVEHLWCCIVPMVEHK